MEGKTMHEEETTTKPIDCDYCLVSIIFASCLQCSVMYFYTCHNLLHILDISNIDKDIELVAGVSWLELFTYEDLLIERVRK